MTSNIKRCTVCKAFVYVPNRDKCCGIDLLQDSSDIVAGEEKIIPEMEGDEKEKRQKKKCYNMSPSTKEAVLKRDKRRCTKCKTKESLHIHHIVYRCNGGTDDLDNLVTLCELCHAEEHRDEPVYNIMIASLWKFEMA